MKTKTPILVIYDKQCPACDFYCNRVRIEESVGELQLINARDSSKVMEEITKLGWDIDQGMVVKVGDQLYYGSESISVLSNLGAKGFDVGNRPNWFNRLNYWLFHSKQRAAIIYPALRNMRNLLLKIMGKRKINNLNIKNNNKF